MRKREEVLFAIIFLVLGFTIGGAVTGSEVLDFCFEKGVAFIELEGYTVGPHPEVVKKLLQNKLITQPERLDALIYNP